MLKQMATKCIRDNTRQCSAIHIFNVTAAGKRHINTLTQYTHMDIPILGVRIYYGSETDVKHNQWAANRCCLSP